VLDDGSRLRLKLDWDELGEPYHRSMLDWYRRLIALRRRLPAIEHGVLAQVEGDLILFERDGVVVRVNLGVADCAAVEIVERA